MNFFEHQDRARKQSRWLIVVFILAVLAIVTAIDLILLLVMGVTGYESGEQPLSRPELVIRQRTSADRWSDRLYRRDWPGQPV